MRERRIIGRTPHRPTTTDSLTADLGVRPGMTLLVHSSLSALGWVCGGEAAVVLALEAALTEAGTLVMPSHTSHLSDPALWQNPAVPESWWEIIRQTMPPYDPHLTPSRGMGAIAECFRKQPGTLRSEHPHMSFVARGPKAAEVTAGHSLERGLGEGSPLARLYELDAWVLLLGVDHESNTSLHLAEYRADYAGKRELTLSAPVIIDGRRQWVSFRDIDLDTSDFKRIGAAFGRQKGAVRRGRVGLAQALLFRQRALVDFAVAWMNAHRGHRAA